MGSGSVLARVASAIRKRVFPSQISEIARPRFTIAQPIEDGVFDVVEVDPSGIIRIVGWCNRDFSVADAATLRLDGQLIPFLQHFRFTRTDVHSGGSTISSQAGLALEYLVPETALGNARVLEVEFGKTGSKYRFEGEILFVDVHYRPMLNTRVVHHRNQIYGSGPPNVTVSPEVVDLARRMKGPVLDFGCGRGALIAELQGIGTEVQGLELDSEVIREHTPAEMAKHVTLYDGTLPTAFPDGRFRSVICSEVLEHIPNYADAIKEIARLATDQVILTVPDSSGIPIGFRHGAVPWHLLEGTHVNFFTQQSLEQALKPYFTRIEFGRIGQSHLNDSIFYVSLAAVCTK